jgi:AcrR family transcriptional regulator
MKNQTSKKSPKKENKPKISTKEKIFDVSLDLFSQKGFNAVSVREIAREVGIRESSIYNHYKSKESILDAIIDHFMSELVSSSLPEEETEKLLETPELFFEVGGKAFLERMSAPKNEKIWRIVSIELYHNKKIRNFYKNVLLEEPINAWEGIFTKMIEKKVIKPVNPKILAHEFFYFAMYLIFEYFILEYEEEGNLMDTVLEQLDNHTKFVIDSVKIDKEPQDPSKHSGVKT